MRRMRRAKIVATVGPSSSTPEKLRDLFLAALREGFAQAGDNVVIAAGYPFGRSGTTNMLRIANVWPCDKCRAAES